jgi:hypothetical protein
MKLMIPILVATLLVGLAVGGGAGYVVGDRQGDSAPVVAVPTVGPVPGSCDYYRLRLGGESGSLGNAERVTLLRLGCAQLPP